MKSLLLIPLLLVSCASSRDSERVLRAKYVGKNADAFFIQHGPPISSYRLDSGGKIYTWEKHGNTVAFLGGSFQKTDMTLNSYASGSSGAGAVMRTPSGTYMAAGATEHDFSGHTQGTAITTSTPGRVLHAHCQVRISTDARGVVQDLRIVKDSIGHWTTSWASECFAEERRMVKR